MYDTISLNFHVAIRRTKIVRTISSMNRFEREYLHESVRALNFCEQFEKLYAIRTRNKLVSFRSSMLYFQRCLFITIFNRWESEDTFLCENARELSQRVKISRMFSHD